MEEKIVAAIKKYLALVYSYGLFQGAILVAQNSDILIQRGYGFTDLRWKIPINHQTKFIVGSLSKQFTAILVLQLVQQGKLDLDDRIIEYLPDYRLDIGHKIKVKHLLTNTSGLANYADRYDFRRELRKHYLDQSEFYRAYCMPDILFLPGSRYDYSNTNFNLLSYIAEKIYNRNFGEILQKQVFSVLDMRNSGIISRLSIINDYYPGYNFQSGSQFYGQNIFWDNYQGAGNIYSTVADLFKWNQALLSHSLINKKLTDRMFSPHIPIDENSYYGYGIVVTYLPDSTKIIEHPGKLHGFLSYNMICPHHKISITILSNNGIPPRPIGLNILKILQEGECKQVNTVILPPYSNALDNTIG
ncbi:MAG TPA: serine hydrolase domain-containing protein [bacterium]|nr:serine hydrolase domain-containing protein [bacterium]